MMQMRLYNKCYYHARVVHKAMVLLSCRQLLSPMCQFQKWISAPYLNQSTFTTYLNQGGLPYTLKTLRNAYIPMKLTQNEVININF